MHPEVAEWVQYAIDLYGPFETVLEVGSLDINGSVRDQFLRAGTVTYWGVDVQAGRGVDEQIEFSARPPDGPWDCVVCTEALEHTPLASQVVANVWRHLRPGGWFVATMAHEGRGPHSAIIEGPPQPGEFYANVAREELMVWLRWAGFVDDFEIDVAREVDLRCVARRAE